MSPLLLQQIAFMVLAAISLSGAWGVIRAHSVFVSALWLILSFVGVAGLYVMLEAGFLAVIQVLVYVGAISVLILFAIMLTEDVMGQAEPASQWPLAVLIVLPFFGMLAKAAFTADWQLSAGSVAPPEGASISAETAKLVTTAIPAEQGFRLPGQVVMLGRSLMTEHLLAFEVVAVVLLVALVGAIVIARD
ncbi:MAG: NADH-quinone oxidoreductase subunit J [Caldilineae bacterium]|nr:NADH-quinone oxidoreductase subunit J [Caldilineae bacterium]